MAFWHIFKKNDKTKERELKAEVSVVLLQQRMDEVAIDLKSSLDKLDLIITKLSDSDVPTAKANDGER